MRDRLKMLIAEANVEWLNKTYDHETDKTLAEYTTDNLIANSVIVLPCKVGDAVYYLTSVDTEKELNVADVFCGTVQSVAFDGKNFWVAAKYTNGLYYHHKAQDFGRDVFLDPEKAAKAFVERRTERR